MAQRGFDLSGWKVIFLMTLPEYLLIPPIILGALAFLLRGLWMPKPKAKPDCGGGCSCKFSHQRK
jgi:hypothetical protein